MAGCALRPRPALGIGTIAFTSEEPVLFTGYVIQNSRRVSISGLTTPWGFPSEGVGGLEFRRYDTNHLVEVRFRYEHYDYNYATGNLEPSTSTYTSIAPGSAGIRCFVNTNCALIFQTIQ